MGTWDRSTRLGGIWRPRPAPGQAAIDFALGATLFLAPLWFGGRHDFGRLLYAITVAAGAAAWAVYRRGGATQGAAWSHAYSVLAASILLVALQLVPLPPSVLAAVSPGVAELLPCWGLAGSEGLQLGVWRTISTTPDATRVGLAVLLSHALLFCIAADRLRDANDIRRMLRAIGAASAAMAALGILQWLTSNGRLLWLYPHPQRDIGAAVQGVFANKNHFAHFVLLGLAPMLLCVQPVKPQRTRRRPPPAATHGAAARAFAARHGWHAAAAVALSAIVLSLSRGALVALLAAAATSGAVLLACGVVRWRRMAGVAAVLLVATVILTSGNTHAVQRRMGALAAGGVETLDGGGARRAIWMANLLAFRSNPWLGYGVGSHADVCPAFIGSPFEKEFTHAESGYLHTLTECGAAGGVLMLAAIALAISWCVRGVRRESDAGRLRAWAAVIAGLTASVCHALADFAWYVPACMCVTVLLAACALRLYQTRPLEGDAPATPPGAGRVPTAFAPLAASLAVALLWGPGLASLPWDRYLLASRHERQLQRQQLRTAGGPGPLTEQIAMLRSSMIDDLRDVLRWRPGHARARARMAGRLQQRFDEDLTRSPNAIGLLTLRDAALASGFSSRRATIDWLRRARGERVADLIEAYQHTRVALTRGPLQGDAYVYLANLSMLAPPAERDARAIIRQALRLRPRDGGVLFEAGRLAMTSGDAERALGYWKLAQQAPGGHRLSVLATLAPIVPAELYLREFQPAIKTVGAALRWYLRRGDTGDLAAIAGYAEAEADAGAARCQGPGYEAWAWRIASSAHTARGDPANALRCAEAAYRAAPTSYGVRRMLALAYAAAGRMDPAGTHARWCLSRQPDDAALAERVLSRRKRTGALAESGAARPR